MRKLMTSIVLAALVMIPVLGMTAENAAVTPKEIASAAVVTAETSLQKGLEIQASVQKAADLAVANFDKAQADLKVAEASGDKEKIKAAKLALRKAATEKDAAILKLSRITAMVDRLKVILAKTKAAADLVEKAKTPAEAQAAADDAEQQAAKSGRVLKAIEEEAVKPFRPIEIIGVTIPTTTTSTTQPSPTPVGKKG